MRPLGGAARDLTVTEGRRAMELYDQIKQYDDSIKVETDAYVLAKLVEYRDELMSELARVVYGDGSQ